MQFIEGMKKKELGIYCGLSGTKDSCGKWSLTVDWEENTEEGSIRVLLPYYKETTLGEYDISRVGYKFNEKLNPNAKTECIRFLENVYRQPFLVDEDTDEYWEPRYHTSSGRGTHEVHLFNLIEKVLRNFRIDDILIDTIVFPRSYGNDLAYHIVDTVRKDLNHSERLDFYDLTRADPRNITINMDWCQWDLESGHIEASFKDREGNDIQLDKRYLDKLQDTVRCKKEFSLGGDIYPVSIRRYIEDFVIFRKVSNLLVGADKVLVVDDNHTSQETISDIVRIIKTYNSKCNICIFTLING